MAPKPLPTLASSKTVTSIEISWDSVIDSLDPDFERDKHDELFYDFGEAGHRARNFYGDPYTSGAYAPQPSPPPPPPPPPPWWFQGSVVDLDFENNRYFGGALADLSIVRASPGYAQNRAGQFVLFGNNVLRLTNQGLLVEDAATNFALWCRDWTQVGLNNWTPTNIAAAKIATGVDGIAGAATRLTAMADGGTILQTTALASGVQRFFSVFIRRVAGGGTINLTQDGGMTWTDVTAQINSAGYTRVSVSQSVATPIVGVMLGGAGDSVDVDFAQLEVPVDNGLPTTPIFTTSAIATRQADVVTAVGNTYLAAVLTPGSVFVKTYNCFGNTPWMIGFSSTFRVRGSNVHFAQIADAGASITTSVGGPQNYGFGVNKTVATYDGTTGSIVACNGPVATGPQGRTGNNGTLYIGDAISQNRALAGYLQRLAFFQTVLPGYGAALTAIT